MKRSLGVLAAVVLMSGCAGSVRHAPAEVVQNMAQFHVLAPNCLAFGVMQPQGFIDAMLVSSKQYSNYYQIDMELYENQGNMTANWWMGLSEAERTEICTYVEANMKFFVVQLDSAARLAADLSAGPRHEPYVAPAAPPIIYVDID